MTGIQSFLLAIDHSFPSYFLSTTPLHSTEFEKEAREEV